MYYPSFSSCGQNTYKNQKYLNFIRYFYFVLDRIGVEFCVVFVKMSWLDLICFFFIENTDCAKRRWINKRILFYSVVLNNTPNVGLCLAIGKVFYRVGLVLPRHVWAHYKGLRPGPLWLMQTSSLPWAVMVARGEQSGDRSQVLTVWWRHRAYSLSSDPGNHVNG